MESIGLGVGYMWKLVMGEKLALTSGFLGLTTESMSFPPCDSKQEKSFGVDLIGEGNEIS